MRRFFGTLVAVLCVLGAMACDSQAGSISLAAADDALLLSAGNNNNFGAADYIVAGRGSAAATVFHSLLRFDVTPIVSAIGGVSQLANLQVDSITLELHSESNATTGTQSWGGTLNTGIYAVTAANRGWVEGTGLNGGAAQPGSNCWSYKAYSTTNWAGSAGLSTAGTDYDPTALGALAVTSSQLTDGASFSVSFTGDSSTLTNLIKTWADDNVTNSRVNPGLMLMDTMATGAGAGMRAYFYTNEKSATLNPHLVVNYSVVPEPCTFALLSTGGFLGLLAYAWRKRR